LRRKKIRLKKIRNGNKKEEVRGREIVKSNPLSIMIFKRIKSTTRTRTLLNEKSLKSSLRINRREKTLRSILLKPPTNEEEEEEAGAGIIGKSKWILLSRSSIPKRNLVSKGLCTRRRSKRSNRSQMSNKTEKVSNTNAKYLIRNNLRSSRTTLLKLLKLLSRNSQIKK
jgi:hypothetical protein